MVNGSNITTKSIWVTISEQPMAWSTENVDTPIPNYTGNALKNDMNGQEHTQTLLALGADKYPAAAWAAQQFNGLGYLPSAGELYNFGIVIRDLGFNRTKSLWSSNETYSRYGYDKEAARLGNGNVTTTTVLKSGSNYVLAFCKLSGPCSIPVNNNGHEYVDLGLPSGTLWATMNVGATSPTEYGNYYMYGMGSKTFDSTDTPYDGTENPLDLSKDTARQTWGGDWHMPTKTQMEELVANTNNEWTTVNNVNGYKFTSKTDSSKYIFLPAAGDWGYGSQYDVGSRGYYWSSTPRDSSRANDLYFLSGDGSVSDYYRRYGYSVRPVIG